MSNYDEQKVMWLKGYVCAVCNLIHENGADKMAGSILTAGIGNKSLQYLRDIGIDSNDIEILEENQKTLWPY